MFASPYTMCKVKNLRGKISEGESPREGGRERKTQVKRRGERKKEKEGGRERKNEEEGGREGKTHRLLEKLFPNNKQRP